MHRLLGASSSHHAFLGLARSSSIGIGGVPKITNSNSWPGSASRECGTPAGMTTTLPGRRGLRFSAEGDRAGAREDVVHLIVAVVNVRQALRDLDDVDVRNPAFATGHDPLDVAEGPVDRRGLITVTDEGLPGDLGHLSPASSEPDRLQ